MISAKLSHMRTLALLAVVWAPIVITAAKLPAPISIAASQLWQGNDGNWSTFPVRLGNPQQLVNVLPSTASTTTWGIAPQGCSAPVDIKDCTDRRGGEFNFNRSTTWEDHGLMTLDVDLTLGFGGGGGQYGTDLVGLGHPGTGGPTINRTMLTAVATFDFFLGVFGLNPRSTNLTNFDNPQPSYMTLLHDAGMIPSISYTYTAGAKYRPTSPLGTLILGGYDTSITATTNMSFNFDSDQSRDLTVGIQGISGSHTEDGKTKQVALLPTPFLAFIDSTTAQFWLPIEACQMFESTFGLTYDSATDLYLVTPELHATLVEKNPSITFTLGQSRSGGATIDITLPYAAFDLSVEYPIVTNAASSYYFPLRRAANETQYVLGRAFLQEAVLTADYGRSNFSIAQRAWTLDTSSNIITILPANETSDGTTLQTVDNKHNLTIAQLVGIAVGVLGVTMLCVCGLACYLHRSKKKKWLEMTHKFESQTPTWQEKKSREAYAQHQKLGSTSTASVSTGHGYEKPLLGGALATSITEVNSPDRSLQDRDIRYGHGDGGYGNSDTSYGTRTNIYGNLDARYANGNATYRSQDGRLGSGSSDDGNVNELTGLNIKELDGTQMERVPLAELEAPEGIHEIDTINILSPTSPFNSTRKSARGLFGIGTRNARDLHPPNAYKGIGARESNRKSWYSWAKGDDRIGSKRGVRKPVGGGPLTADTRRTTALSESSYYSTYDSDKYTSKYSSEYSTMRTPIPMPIPTPSIREQNAAFGHVGLVPANRAPGAAFSYAIEQTQEPERPVTRGKVESLSPLSPLKPVVYKPPGWGSARNDGARTGNLKREDTMKRDDVSEAAAEEGTLRFGGFF